MDRLRRIDLEMEGKEVEKLEVGQDMAGIDRTVEVGRTGVSRRTTGVVGEGQDRAEAVGEWR